MIDQEQILDIYGAISTKTGEMLAAARSADWDRLVALEEDCRALIERLKRSKTDPVASTRFVQRKIAYIRKALDDDAKIRELTEPWMAQLETYLGSVRQEKKLQRTYTVG